MYSSELDDIAFFYYTVQAAYHLDQIPISSLEELDIDMVQRLSKAAHFDGVKLILAVDVYDKNLIVKSFSPDRQSKPLLPFFESPKSVIYVSNSADIDEVIEKLQEMSERYASLNAPPFQKYNDDDGPGGDIHNVTVAEFQRGNREAKYKHEAFMRDHGMHQTVIPNNYKKRPKPVRII
jgi:hypothetical protein